MLRLCLFACLLYCCSVRNAAAQTGFFPLSHLTTSEGLAQDFVTSIAQTPDGFMWFGSHDGLTRFDGNHCTVFKHRMNDSTSLPDNRISGLATDATGRLWVSTNKGLCYLTASGAYFQRVKIALNEQESPEKINPHVSELKFDQKGDAWAMYDSLLMRFNLNTHRATFFKLPCKIRAEYDICVDSRGRVWVTVVGQHLTCYDTRTGVFHYIRGLDKPLGAVYPWPMSVREDSNGVIWNADWDQCFYRYNELKQEFEPVPGLAKGIATTFLFEDRKNAPPVIWTGGGAHGLARIDCANYHVTEFPPDPRDAFAHNNTRVYAIHRDPYTGIVWFGTEMGVEYYDPGALAFGRVLLPMNPNQDQFYSVSGLMPQIDDPDKYWLSVWAVGLYEWSRHDGTFLRYDVANKGVHSNEIFDIARDREGNLWLAMAGGVECFNPRTKKRRFYAQPPPYNGPVDKALSVEVGPDGMVWSGTNHGVLMQTNPRTGVVRPIPLYRYDGKTFDIYSLWHLKLDRKGRVLVGSPNGLLRYDPATGKNDHLLYRLPIRFVAEAVEAPDQHLYVATQEGVVVLDSLDKVVKTINTISGLHNDNIQKLDIDPRGNVWIATVNGLHRYHTDSGRIDYFSKEDGLFMTNLNQGFTVMPNGELFASGDFSFNIAACDQMLTDNRPPRLAVESVKVANHTLDCLPGSPVTLHPGENVVSFNIALIHFTHPQKTSLSYRLLGFDSTWIEAQQPTITYTNLEVGQYTLQVRARNGSGIWSTHNLNVPVTVLAPFYQTWLFRLFLMLSMAAGIWGIARYRLNMRHKVEAMQSRAKELEKQQLLNEVALLKTQVNPHFLFNSLSILSALVHVDANLAEQFIEHLSRSYRYILEQKEQPLVSLRTELEFIRAYTFLLKIRFENKFDLQFNIDENLLDHYRIAPLTLQLLIENAVKHNKMSAKEPLLIGVYAEKNVLVVTNPLQPRPVKEPSTGTGLSNIKARYALLTDRPVQAGEMPDGTFVVRIPLL